MKYPALGLTMATSAVLCWRPSAAARAAHGLTVQRSAGATAAGVDFDHLRQSVVRIQAVSASFDWLLPFLPGQDGVGLGSGFVVQAEPYPLIATNAHVINDAKQVTLQLLLYGEHQWPAKVVSICPKFDLALLVLEDSRLFLKAMATQNITLQALPLANGVAAMGEDVVALGFPLGQDALKISKGNIAGNEDVDGNICIQSTAPISPGSSGGPLLDASAHAVVGVNFAKSTEGENINYVIPAWRVGQIMRKHLQEQPAEPADGKWKRVHVQVPKPDITAIEANDALYALSGGCDHGIYISRVGERSFFQKADPPVPAGSFLTKVNGMPLDSFGMGLNTAFAADRVSFPDLFFMVPDLNADVEFTTCFHGKTTAHKVSMAWAPEYERGVRYVDEPQMAGMPHAFEMFGDICVMEMTVNHISAVLSSSGDPGPARWLHPDLVAKPRLVVSYVRSSSYASDIIPTGAAVAKINGQEVRTLEDFREHFLPGDDKSGVWTLETDMGKVAAVMFNRSMAQELAGGQDLTPGVALAAQRLGLVKGGGAAAGRTAGASAGSSAAGEASSTDASVRRHSLLSETRFQELATATGAQARGARAAGPLVARRPAPGLARSTRPETAFGLRWPDA